MTPKEMQNLQAGDIIYHVSCPDIRYIVTANYGDRVTAVRSVDVTNPNEWEVAVKGKNNG